MRWLAFSVAFPGRVVTAAEADRERRETAAAFFFGLAGRRRDPAAVRLRRAGDCFLTAAADDDIVEGLYWLREAVLRELHLPPAAERALLAPDDHPLHDIERRELLYLARAGTRDMKVLAARRLCAETNSPDAQATCHQLQFDADAWVRAAATNDE